MKRMAWNGKYGPKPVVFQGWCITENCGKEVWSKKDGTVRCKDCLREIYEKRGFVRASSTKKPRKYIYAPNTSY